MRFFEPGADSARENEPLTSEEFTCGPEHCSYLGYWDSPSPLHPSLHSKISPTQDHGELATPDHLREYRDMLMTVRDRLQTMLNDGMSVEQIVASKPTSDLDARWYPENWFIAGDRMVE